MFIISPATSFDAKPASIAQLLRRPCKMRTVISVTASCPFAAGQQPRNQS